MNKFVQRFEQHRGRNFLTEEREQDIQPPKEPLQEPIQYVNRGVSSQDQDPVSTDLLIYRLTI